MKYSKCEEKKHPKKTEHGLNRNQFISEKRYVTELEEE